MGFRDRAPEFEAANAVIIGASFDTVAEQKTFAETEGFPYKLISDEDRSIGQAYGAQKSTEEPYPDFPRRISYLIDPDGNVAVAYDLSGKDLGEHAAEVLADILARS